MEDKDIRWTQRFSNYRKALAKLSAAVVNEDVDSYSDLEKEGLVKRFEYTYELAWKTLQDFLREKGPNARYSTSFSGWLHQKWNRLDEYEEVERNYHTYL